MHLPTRLTPLLAALPLVLASTTGPALAIALTPCNPFQLVHTYTGPGAAGEVVNGQFVPRIDHRPLAVDGCTPGGDGDPETGFGGGLFPGAGEPCLPPGSIGHHIAAAGGSYWADNIAVLPVAWVAETDGQIIPCVGDGIVSSDPVVEPSDCGSGAVGVYTFPFQNSPATLAPNVAGGACTPADGYVWVTMIAGPVYTQPCATCVPTLLFVSTPLSGLITDAGPLP